MPTTDNQSIILPGLTLGFATSVAMWGVGYITHLGGAWAPPAVVFVLLALVLVCGGFLAARMTPAKTSWKPTLIAGLTTSLVNLMILGSVLAKPTELDPNAEATAELALHHNWVLITLGSVLAQTFLMMAGGHFGARKDPDDPNRSRSCEWWLSRFAIVGALSALPVILSGGLVTSAGAGMAVPDWPATFGDNMFLFSLSKMTGGIYYEHAHRLFGALVGFTTLVLTLVAATHSRSKPMAFAAFFVLAVGMLASFAVDSGVIHNFAPIAGIIAGAFLAFKFCGWRYGVVILALSLVSIQGVLGGVRVLLDSTALAMAHGISGQITFTLLCLLGAFLSPSWRTAQREPGDNFARKLCTVLAVFMVIQMFLGAGTRHFNLSGAFLHPHILGALIIIVIAPMAGFRTKSKHADRPPLKRLATMMLHTVYLQFVLGGMALWVVIANRDNTETPALELVVRTAHQATGALLLAFTALLAVWTLRLISARKTPIPE